MFENTMPRYEILSQDAMASLETAWRRLMTEVGVEFMHDDALELFRKAGQKVVDKTVFLDPEFVLAQVAKAPKEFDVQARNPANNVHIGGNMMAFSGVYGPPFVREGAVRRDAMMDDFRNFTEAGAGLCGARLGRRHHLRAVRHPARLAPPRHDLRAADPDRQDLHGQCRHRRERPRHHRDGRDHVRRPRGHREDTRLDLADQLQLPAPVGRPHAGVPVRVRQGRPAGRADAVHPDGRDVAGHDPGSVWCSRSSRPCRASPWRSSYAPGRRSSSARSCPTSTCSPARRRSARPSRASACCAPDRSRGASACRSGPVAGSRPLTRPTRRPATRRS